VDTRLQRKSWPLHTTCSAPVPLPCCQPARELLVPLLLQTLCWAPAGQDQLPLAASDRARGPQHCNRSKLRNPRHSSNSPSQQPLPPHPTRRRWALQVPVSALPLRPGQTWVLPSLPPRPADRCRWAPRRGCCPPGPALGSQIQSSQRKKLKLSADYLLISGPFITALILHTYCSGLGGHTLVFILKPLTLSHPCSALQ